jgi:hypothetical protein
MAVWYHASNHISMNPVRLRRWLCGFAAVLASCSLRADVAPVITNQPQNVACLECQPARFNVGFSGTLNYIQWYRDGSAIPGFLARARSYIVPHAALSDNGSQFYAIVTNYAGAVTTTVATLTVSTNLLPFRALEVRSCPILNRLLVPFESCPFNTNTATNLANFSLSGSATILSIAVTNETNALITTSPLVNGSNYTLTISNVMDWNGQVMAPNPTQITFTAGSYSGISFTAQPVDFATYPGQTVTLNAQASAASLCSTGLISPLLQWQKASEGVPFADIPGATNISYSFIYDLPNCWAGPAFYRVRAFADGLSGTSSVATGYALDYDAFPPQLFYAWRGALASNQVVLQFDWTRVALSSATNVNLYSINNGVQVLNAGYGSNDYASHFYVVLTTTPLTNGAYYFITVSNIQAEGCAFPSNYFAYPQWQVISNYGAHYSAGHEYIYIEAEDYDGKSVTSEGNTWYRAYDWTASLGRCVSPTFTTGTYPRLDYGVNFPSEGVWYVWLRGRGSGGATVGIDGAINPEGTYVGDLGNSTNGWNNSFWNWTTENYLGRARITITNAGLHTFNIRGGYASVDAILLTTNSAFAISPRTNLFSNEVNCSGIADPKPIICQWPPPREPTLDYRVHLRRAGTNWELSWPPGATLQETDDITPKPVTPWFSSADWRAVTNASNPMIVSNAPTRFYRVQFYNF